MSFAAPIFLLALALVPLGVLAQRLAARRRRHYAIRFPAAGTVAALGTGGASWRRRLPPVLLGLAVAALALALARPERTVAVPIERASVVLIIDTSRSMLAEDVSPDRMIAAKRAARSFVDGVPDELRVGVVAYSSTPHTVLPATTDHDAAAATVDSLEADGGTNTGGAIAAALEALERDAGEGEGENGDGATRDAPPAAIVLLSDGKSTEGPDPIEIARRAGRERVPIYSVAFGTPDGVVEGPFGQVIPVPPDPEALREIARVSRGEAFEIDDAGELDAVYEQLGSQLGSRPEQREVTAGFAGAGLVLLLLGALLAVRWRGRIA